jgi:enoyl-CoA hydratase
MSQATSPVPETILVETEGRVGVIRLNRPKVLNALNSQLMNEVTAALSALDANPKIGCIVITGSDKAFAAGADVKEMRSQSFIEMHESDYFAGWEALGRIRKPIIAAVSGMALGGGCELAMACDFIIAAAGAKFGQPEITLGIIPGIGGSQRLTRAVGKAKAMEMCLTGRAMDASEAEQAGLVARVVPAADLMTVVMATARIIAGMSLPAVMMLKEAINRSFETTLSEGIRFERRLFHSLFATNDQLEGMSAFLEKRPPTFLHK